MGIALAGYAAYAVVTSTTGRIGLAVLALALATTILVQRWQVRRAVAAFRSAHQATGKDLLIVYSASPHWQPYIEQNWIPRWEDRAVILNRSAPDWQTRPEALLWRRLSGRNDHTPIAIVVPNHGGPQVVRFFRAFRDHKHGKQETLRGKEADQESALLESASG